ncbi:peptidoglycan-associated lipoprotein Pal [Candidatus Gillettellia adelgis]
MHSNKILHVFFITLLVIGVSGCSSNQYKNDDQTHIKADTDIENSRHDFSSTEETLLEIEALHKNKTVYFNLDKYDISSAFTQMLDAHGTFLRNHSFYKVTIEGHADERGTPEYNIALGERRANSVKMYLQSKGVAADQISIISYGEGKPAALGHDEATYSKNRRAVLIY